LANLIAANFHVSVSGMQIQISGATIGSDYAIFSVQGQVVKTGKIQNGTENIRVPNKGIYLVRVGNKTSKMNVK
jgi:hypothetical protein